MQKQLSERQLAANRANAQKSTGPRTAEGKNTSSRNATRHALTGQVTIMPGEDRDAHDAFCESIVLAYGAQGDLELQVAQSIAEDEWRLNRMRAMERNVLDMGFDGPEGDIETDHPAIHSAITQAQVLRNNMAFFSNLSLYQTRIQRGIHKEEARLRTIQAEREAATQEALREPKYPTAQAVGAGQTWDPAPDFPPRRGFVYSFPEINRLLDRDRRVDKGFRLHIGGRKTDSEAA